MTLSHLEKRNANTQKNDAGTEQDNANLVSCQERSDLLSDLLGFG